MKNIQLIFVSLVLIGLLSLSSCGSKSSKAKKDGECCPHDKTQEIKNEKI